MHTHTHTRTHTHTHILTQIHTHKHTHTHTQNVFMHKWKHTTMDTLHITWTPKKELLSLCESPRLHIDMNVFSRSLRFDFWINIWTKFGIIRCLVDREEGTECDWMISHCIPTIFCPPTWLFLPTIFGGRDFSDPFKMANFGILKLCL